jgi:hypothetical protein
MSATIDLDPNEEKVIKSFNKYTKKQTRAVFKENIEEVFEARTNEDSNIEKAIEIM